MNAKGKAPCCKRVYRSGGSFRGSPCANEAKVERDGLWYCTTHDPVRVEEKRKEADRKWNEKYNREKRDREARDSALAEQKRRAEMFPDLLEALEPFAHFAEAVVRFAEGPGNFPKSGALYCLHGHGLEEREITVEHFRQALAAIAKARGEA